jgi:histidinol dehydrogenase
MQADIFPIYDTSTGKTRLLERKPVDESPASPALLDGITRIFGEPLSPEEAVKRIIRSVRENGDAGLKHWSARIDGASPDTFLVPKEDLDKAFVEIPVSQLESLELMATRIRRFHENQPLNSWISQEGGGYLGQLIRPIRRVGLYVPAGTAPLPSSVLMSAIPARVAGVAEIAVAVPPLRGTGRIAPIILAACAVCGIQKVYMMGGAQAIAALAYGTESIPAVDKIFGPGNLFVTLAKQQVFGKVGIDGLAGPTETMVIADDYANPTWVAADLLAQAEHDILASAILLTPSKELARAVKLQISKQIEALPRAETIVRSLIYRGGAVITRDIEEAAELANYYAPEHLCLAVADPWQLSSKIHAAGGIFLGEHSFEVLGDYVAGPSHVMPTGGTARFASPLNVWDFVHIISLIALSHETASEIIPHAVEIAQAEGLHAHARAAAIRLESSS